MGNMKKILALVIAFILLSACGPKLYYPSLDWLIPWYVDDYISLEPDQSSRFRTQLARQLDWHCRTQLPEYAEFLRDLRREVDHGDRNPVILGKRDGVAHVGRRQCLEAPQLRSLREGAEELIVVVNQQNCRAIVFHITPSRSVRSTYRRVTRGVAPTFANPVGRRGVLRPGSAATC